MNSAFDPKRLWWIVWVVAAWLVVKILWVAVEWIVPLPVTGVEQTESRVKHSLHYRYRLASNTPVKAPTKTPKAPPKPPARKTLQGYRLVGIYSRSDYAVVTLVRGNKSFVVSSGEHGGEIAGYRLKDANATTARFVKGDETVTLKLYEKKLPASGAASSIRSTEEPAPRKAVGQTAAAEASSEESALIEEREDGTRLIDRNLIEEYTRSPDKIWKNIGLYEVKSDGKLGGFKVRFVRKGSPFAKLGLRRGDVIKAINGEPIVDYATPMRMLRSADSIEDLSITIERNHEEQELKYEVK
jgi:general secretion pathway protein C